MTKKRFLSSVAAAATMVGACLFLAPTAHAASGSCTYPNGLPKSCTDGTTTCNIVYSAKFPFIPTVRCP